MQMQTLMCSPQWKWTYLHSKLWKSRRRSGCWHRGNRTSRHHHQNCRRRRSCWTNWIRPRRLRRQERHGCDPCHLHHRRRSWSQSPASRRVRRRRKPERRRRRHRHVTRAIAEPPARKNSQPWWRPSNGWSAGPSLKPQPQCARTANRRCRQSVGSAPSAARRTSPHRQEPRPPIGAGPRVSGAAWVPASQAAPRARLAFREARMDSSAAAYVICSESIDLSE